MKRRKKREPGARHLRPTRRELRMYSHGLTRSTQPMTRAMLECIEYRFGTLRPVDNGSVAEVARRNGIPVRTLQDRVRKAMILLPAALRDIQKIG